MPCGPRNSVLVEHDLQDPSYPLLVEERNDSPALGAGAGTLAKLRQRLGEARDELVERVEQLGVTLDQLAVEHGRRAQRQQADERAHLERDPLPVGHPHHVVVEAVLLVPQRRVALRRVHRDRDPHEVGEELQRHVEVRPGRAWPARAAICSIHWQYSAIHAVPSACSS